MELGEIGSIVLIVTVSIFALFPVLFWLLWKFAPNPKFAAQSRLIDSDERIWYLKWYRAYFAPFILGTIVFALIWFVILRLLGSVINDRLPDARFTFVPSFHLWFIAALLLGVLSSAPVGILIMRKWMGSDWERYQFLASRLSPFDDRKFKPVLGLMIAALILAIALGFDTYAYVDDSEFITNGFLDLRESRHSLASIRRLYSVSCVETPLKLRDEPHFAIEFDDDATWTTRDGCRAPQPDADSDAFSWLSKETGKPIESALTFD